MGLEAEEAARQEAVRREATERARRETASARQQGAELSATVGTLKEELGAARTALEAERQAVAEASRKAAEMVREEQRRAAAERVAAACTRLQRAWRWRRAQRRGKSRAGGPRTRRSGAATGSPIHHKKYFLLPTMRGALRTWNIYLTRFSGWYFYSKVIKGFHLVPP